MIFLFFFQLDDWVLCRIYNKKGTLEKQELLNANNNKMHNNSEMEDKKPEILNTCALPPPAALPTVAANEYVYFDTSDSVPRLHTDSSCSEHVVSPEFTCEVQSEPKYWEKNLDFPFNYMDAMDNGFVSQLQGGSSSQMSPLQDMFMYLPKTY